MIEAIRKRRSVRAFLKKNVEGDKLEEVLRAASFSPTSWGTRAWEFIVVRDPAMKALLSKATVHAAFVKAAPVVVVLCYDGAKGRRFKEDSSICAGYMLLEAVNQGLGGCFVQVADSGEPQGSAEPYVKDLLGIPGPYRVQCMIPIGYALRALKEHSEAEFSPGKVHAERF